MQLWKGEVMLPDYEDIKAAAQYVTPDWYDSNGVPRYAEFEPDMLGVYDRYALLVEIACQSCDQRFLVGEGFYHYMKSRQTGEFITVTLEQLATGYHYGDPPRHSGCGAGDTMNCVDIKIVEAWERDKDPFKGWVRRPDIEAIDIYPDWAK